MTNLATDYIDGAWQAAVAFDLAPTDIAILSHSENVVCDLTMPDGGHLAMRLHRPGYSTIAELNSEVAWVTALGEAGLPVPRARRTAGGDHYTTVQIGDRPVLVGVVGWVEGSPLGGPTDAGGPEAVDHYHRIGELSGRIRAHSAAWTPPDGFTRRRWDVDGLFGDNPHWGRFWEVEALSDAQRALFTRARNELVEELSSLPTDGSRFGLIHADLHLGNVMADGDHLTMIDFDDSGFGWFAHELACALHTQLGKPWFDDARAAMFDGYRTVHPLDAIDEALVDTFLAVRCLMFVGWLAGRPEVPLFAEFDDLATLAEVTVGRYLDR